MTLALAWLAERATELFLRLLAPFLPSDGE
jgi:hypothetical protein